MLCINVKAIAPVLRFLDISLIGNLFEIIYIYITIKAPGKSCGVKIQSLDSRKDDGARHTPKREVSGDRYKTLTWFTGLRFL